MIESVGVADVNITGLSPVGGLVGFNSFSTVSGCFSTGSVNGTSQVGGLVGWNYQSSVSISYGTASVNGGGEVGGLIGMNSASSSVRLSYSAGGVSGSGANVGGFVGYNSGSTVNTCFWDIQISGIDTSAGGGTGDSTAAMKNPLTFSDSGWSPVVWNMGDGINNGYPYLRWQNTTGTQLLAAVSPDSGVGTSGNPYLIATLDNLYWIYQKGSWSAHYEQTADINASSDSSWNSGKGFYPIGITGSNSFTGSYEGQNHTISGLYVKIGTQYEGLFGYTTGSTLKNVRLVNCRIISAGGSTGGLVGEADNTTVTACSVSGSIGASGNDIGGLIGTTGTGTSVSKCYAEGTITATNLQEVGGLIGITSSGGSITDCYVTDSLNVGDYGECAGGLVGQNDGTISDCYSTGCVTGGSSGFYVAGFVGYNGSTVSKCFWNTDSSGATGIGGGLRPAPPA